VNHFFQKFLVFFKNGHFKNVHFQKIRFRFEKNDENIDQTIMV
jgi:hypothetical protein